MEKNEELELCRPIFEALLVSVILIAIVASFTSAISATIFQRQCIVFLCALVSGGLVRAEKLMEQNRLPKFWTKRIF